MRKQAWSPPGPGTSISKAPVNIDRLVMMYHSLRNLSVILWEQTASDPVSVCSRQSLTSYIQLQNAASIAVSFYSDFICFILTSFVDKSYLLV